MMGMGEFSLSLSLRCPWQCLVSYVSRGHDAMQGAVNFTDD